jgi:hypothetical protein
VKKTKGMGKSRRAHPATQQIDYSPLESHNMWMKRGSKPDMVVNAIWDAEAGVWVATSDDVPGLATESKSFEALLKKLRTLVPELLELNGAMPRSGRAPYRVVAERYEGVQAAE